MNIGETAMMINNITPKKRRSISKNIDEITVQMSETTLKINDITMNISKMSIDIHEMRMNPTDMAVKNIYMKHQ